MSALDDRCNAALRRLADQAAHERRLWWHKVLDGLVLGLWGVVALLVILLGHAFRQ